MAARPWPWSPTGGVTATVVRSSRAGPPRWCPMASNASGTSWGRLVRFPAQFAGQRWLAYTDGITEACDTLGAKDGPRDGPLGSDPDERSEPHDAGPGVRGDVDRKRPCRHRAGRIQRHRT
ncbi:hypothetical protein FRAHR75_1890005 [Frankia sp. Hr75.2]|nr:hypothetical protein FRAHR75_1890005 [Frankia sp. Hr75.2]